MRRASDNLSDPDRNLAESSGPTEVPEGMDLITEETENRIHTPPPRIAARFYRPTNNRRKSSAASSRRNSISSAHSHQSHASDRHGRPQSNHIAQHLRRATILEDRKARLADRAAHAEKVRLRAALAKAAPRSTTNSEERALAAQQAREKNLAEIVANCAEEVKRAKGIAESMKEKREAEGKKLRREMEERLAEAERRRGEILNRGNVKRGRSLSQPRKSLSPLPDVQEMPDVKPILNEAAAASRIQQRWRIHQRWKALKAFTDLGLTGKKKVLLTTAHILRMCGMNEGESGSVNELTAVRTFLSAFLILGHPTQVLSNKANVSQQEQVGAVPMRRDDLANPQLQDLVAKARDLLISFENVLSRLTAANNYTPPPGQLSTLSETYATFYNAFIAWKARDSSAIIEMMVLQFVELDSIWQTVKDSTEEAVTASYRDGIRENQLKLMVRIKKLAGPAQGKRLITNAIREARKTKAAQKPAGDSKPRAAASTPVPEELSASVTTVASHLQTLTPPPTPSRESTSFADELRTASSVLPDNRIMVHELAINKEYRIEIEDCLEQRGAVNQLIFDSMRQEVASGNSDPWVLAMADNIRGKLQRLLKSETSIYKQIGEVLDTDLVSRELQVGSFSYEKFFSYMGSLLPRLCAPVRDEEVKELVENTFRRGDVVDRLQALMRFIDLMQLDYANHMLQESASMLIEHAVPYETKQFSEDMEKTNNDLSVTTAAWKEARTKVLAEATRRDPENINLARNRPTPEKIYAQFLVDIFTSLGPASLIPETLLLDRKRITRIRTELLRIVTTGAILIQSKNLLKRDMRSQWKTEATRIFAVLESSSSPDQAIQGIQVALESSHSMPAATKSHIRELSTRIVNCSASISNTASSGELRDPVMRLLISRLRMHLLGRLTANTEREKVKSASTASESLATAGMPEFVSRVGKIVEEIGRVGSLDRSSHGGWYEFVAGQIDAATAEVDN
ncbi:hypothetical protein B7494_g2462 [Chlorociboria aeruginascens]|nr:hypothetical protein B7494_g2462 [Chlorociboria aeruginascens]